MKKRLVIIVVALVAVVVIAGLIVAGSVDHYRPRVQAELQSKLNRPVTLGKLGLKLFPLSISVDGLTIGESPAFPTGRPFATASQVFIGVRFLSLLRGNPAIGKLVLDKPRIELVRNAAGVWNYSSLGSSNVPAGAATQTPPSPQPAPSAQPAPNAPAPSNSQASNNQPSIPLSNLQINDGQLGYIDQTTKQPRAVYDH